MRGFGGFRVARWRGGRSSSVSMLVSSDGLSIIECYQADDNDSLNSSCTLCLLAEVAHIRCP